MTKSEKKLLEFKLAQLSALWQDRMESIFTLADSLRSFCNAIIVEICDELDLTSMTTVTYHGEASKRVGSGDQGPPLPSSIEGEPIFWE